MAISEIQSLGHVNLGLTSASKSESGFSLIELVIAIAILLTLGTAATRLLSASLNIRARENVKSSGVADAQRGINMMSREIANSGYGLSSNGIVASDSTSSAIRVRANLNAADKETTSATVTDKDEDIKYMLYTDTTQSYIVRLDVNTTAQEMILANRVDSLVIRYYSDRVLYTPGSCDISNVTNAAGATASEVTDKTKAKYVVLSLCVTLPAVGSSGSDGYQPASRVQLTSDVALRNSDLVNY